MNPLDDASPRAAPAGAAHDRTLPLAPTDALRQRAPAGIGPEARPGASPPDAAPVRGTRRAPTVAEGPHERLLVEGPDRLSSIDLLTVLLGRSGRARRATNAAWRLLERFGSLRRVSAATIGELGAPGTLSSASAVRLAAAFALGRRAWARRLERGEPLRSSAEIFERYGPLLVDARKERFLVVLLDGKNRVMREDVVSEGSLTSSPAHPREVFAAAVRESAAAIVLVHNHPSGDPEPSTDDVEVTKRLVAVGELLGIRVADHVVVGDGRYVSFLDRGWVPAT